MYRLIRQLQAFEESASAHIHALRRAAFIHYLIASIIAYTIFTA